MSPKYTSPLWSVAVLNGAASAAPALTDWFKGGATSDVPQAETTVIKGHFTSFKRDAGYGFVETGDHQKYFGHVNNVTDIRLKETLQNTPYDAGNTLYIAVTFRKAGQTRHDAKYQEAIDIRPV
jgi:hypothetical protein